MRYLYTFILWCFVMSVISCGKKVENEYVSSQSSYAKCLVGAPEWVLSENIDSPTLYAVGSAKIGKAGLSFALEEAEAVARDRLARRMIVKVKNMTKRFIQSISNGNTENVDKVVTNVSKQVSYITLSGSRTVKKWISPCDEIYVLVTVDSVYVQDEIKKAILTSLKNEKVLWKLFQAEKAYKDLEKEIQREFKWNIN